MESPFSNIFKSLQAYITAQLPGIPYVDMDYGQLESHERPSVAFPCVLIDLTDFSMEDATSNVQQVSGRIVLKLACDPYTSTSNITPETYVDAALEFLELEQALYLKLSGWKPAIADDKKAAPLSRLAYQMDNRRPGIKVRVMAFGTSFTDFSAKPAKLTAPATVLVTEEIQ